MNGRRSAWAVWGLNAVLMIAMPFLAAAARTQESDAFGYVFIPLTVMGFATVGALIRSRQPGNRIGLILAWIGLAAATAIIAGTYATFSFDHAETTLPFARWAAWLGRAGFALMFAPIPMIFLLFPNGRVPSPRWRWLLWTMLGALATNVVLFAVTPGVVDSGFTELQTTVTNPLGLPASWKRTVETVTEIAGLVAFAGSFLCVLSLVLRFRRAAGEERQQIRWVAYVAAVAAAIPLAGLLIAAIRELAGVEVSDSDSLGNAMFLGFFVVLLIGIPAACAIAILRYRLWDLDVVIKKTVVFGVVAAGITLVALLVLLILPVSALGTGLSGWERGLLLVGVGIGVLLAPLRRIARRLADRIVYGERATPYEVLTAFGDRVGETYSTDDVLPRMAQLLASGTGAGSARVLLRVGSGLREVARSPEDGPLPAEEHTVPVVDRGEELGALAVSMPANDPMNPAKEKLIRDLASQAGLVLRNARLVEELRASRRRLVAAQDEERRRLERNIHDGAQQQLVALSVKLRLADQMVERDPAKARETIEQLQVEATDALEDLRDLARGIYPPLLADEGLAVALGSQIRKSPIPVELVPDRVARYGEEVEAAVYFCCLEALQNVAKYARATRVSVHLRHRDDVLAFEVIDDGVGFDPDFVTRGLGLQGMADRIEAVGGRLSIRSSPGAGTTVLGVVPTGSP